jgi:hypothetical protein
MGNSRLSFTISPLPATAAIPPFITWIAVMDDVRAKQASCWVGVRFSSDLNNGSARLCGRLAAAR